MALRVPTTSRVCLNCKINSDANAGKEFHEVFDEVGLELQLPFLVKTFFHIDLNKEDKQHLCDDCVNHLIEFYDLEELVKEKSCKTNILKNELECSNNEDSSQYPQNESFDQNNTHYNLPKSNSIEYANFKTFVSPQGADDIEINKHNKSEDKDCTEYTNIEDVGYFFNENRSAPFARHHNQSSNDIAENFPEEGVDQTGKREVAQDFNILLSSSVIKNEKSYVPEFNEHMEFVSDDENQNVEINKQSNAKSIVGSIQQEIKEQEDSQDFSISSSAIKDEKLDELEANEHMEFISDDENQNLEINKQYNSNSIVNVCKEEYKAEEAYAPNKTYNENESQRDLHDEELVDRLNQDLSSDDSNSLLEELKTTELNNIEHIDSDDFSEQEDISSDTCLLEEENLLDENILSEGYDQVDLNEYLDKVLKTKFQDLLLTCEMECKLCLEKYNSFGELLKHACVVEFEEKQQLSCIIKDCEEHAKDLPTLARHLVLKHYDKIESTVICGRCCHCQKKFSNVLDLNKHSCCRKIKQITGAPKYCKYCDLNFQSLKRYTFHMQFHLKNHRPKICLLCGDLFKNSNDFFEHTQYKHNPNTVLACERCDRFYKDIQVFNNHMKFHQESKYLHKCTLCPKKYTNKFGLNQHMDIYHNKSKAFQCKYCPKKYGYKRSYLNHIKTHATFANVQTFICSTCGLITNNMEMIKEHIESDMESPCFSSPVEKKILVLGYSCENCSLDFCTIKHLKDHRLSDSHSDDKFYCGMCRKSFIALSQMRFHSFNDNECKEWQKTFPITRHFVCNIGDCQEFYTSWSALYYHKKHHHKTEEKTNSPTEFKCQFCQQLCSSKQLLAIHVAKIHNNAKLQCSHCKSNFPSKNILQKHIDKKHTPVECDICLKKFKHRRNFEIHINAVHNNMKRYFCRHCKKGYFYKNQLNIHEKNFHPQL